MGRDLALKPWTSFIVIWLKVYLVMSLVFCFSWLLPQGVAFHLQGLSAERVQWLTSQFLLDKSGFVQYWHWLRGALVLDFGSSYYNPEVSILSSLATPWLQSMKLALVAVLLVVVILFFSFFLYLKAPKARWVLEVFYTAVQSMPIFVLAALLVSWLAISWGVLPVALWESPQHMILPALTLALRPAANLFKIILAEISETSKKDFVRTAVGKGLTQSLVFWRHIFRPSLAGSVSYLAMIFTSLATGSIIVELLFAIPGIGHVFIEALGQRDFPLLVVLCGYFSLLLQLNNWGAEKIRSWLDPRLQV